MESDKPLQVPQLPPVAAIVAGDLHSCACTKAGAVYCFGANAAGQLGTGTTKDVTTPAKVPNVSGVRSISASVDHSCAVDGKGDVWCWGSNGTDKGLDGVPDVITGKLGQDAAVKNRLRPARVGGVAHVATVTTGDDHTCALTAGGEIWCWGSNADGQLGAKVGQLSVKPVKVAVPAAP
jgi:alpha-tubulin suppressor-like RCC1 family protein